ncbi:MAG: nucleotidyltransferase family protein [Gemmatimonadales bacterium]|nr:MAG: nucleotidyltransferase family protein [Gemmatimonadales bacterium]
MRRPGSHATLTALFAADDRARRRTQPMVTQAPSGDGSLPLAALDLTPAAIRERFRWAQRNGHPQYLWPNVPVGAWRSGLDEIERVSRAVLGGAGGPTSLRLPSGSVEALGVAAFSSGMGPLLGYWLEAGLLGAPEAVRQLLLLHLAHGRLRARRLEDQAQRVLQVLADVDIRGTVLKGVETGRRFFPSPGTRPSSDVDLLVEPGRMDEAEVALREAGYDCLSPRNPRRDRSEWAPRGASRDLRSLDLTHGDNPITIDLHGSLDRNVLGIATVGFGSLDHHRRVPWADVHPAGGVLAQPLLTAFLAVHASTGLLNLTMIRMTELVLVIRSGLETGDLVWAELSDALAQSGGDRFVHPAFEMAERLVPGTVDPGFREEVARRATSRVRTYVAALTPATAQRLEVRSMRERLMWVSGPLDLARTIRETVVPPGLGSVRSLGRLYSQRIWRVLRGRVSLGPDRTES